MTRRLRNTDPSLTHLITMRTNEAALWMVPSQSVNEIIGGILARYQELLGIIIYCYSFQSNHYHLMARAPFGNLDEFEENINREISKRMNRLRGRRGKFWAGRYHDQIVLNDSDQLSAYLYVTANPVKHGLVEHPNEWPGLSSYRQMLSGVSQTYSFTHYSKRDSNGTPTKSFHKLTLSPLPQFNGQSHAEQKRTILESINAQSQRFRERRERASQGFLGRKAVLDQRPGSIPKEISYSSRKSAYTVSNVRLKEFRESERLRHRRYHEASRHFRLGNLAVEFPSFCFHPPLQRTPRSEPFRPLPKVRQ
ncbi:MAG: hypothetical protein J0M12_09340 [Deltaproteobacteria bacterium]|nr:hypothetical protein [Deltaproteobacteria bacterium]